MSTPPSAARRLADIQTQRPLIVLAGNPNTGKTTLFNRLTGSHARVGNYPGVTVERLSSRFWLEDFGAVDLMDLPGSYSIVGRSAEEQIAINQLMGLGAEKTPNLVVVCVDATNLLRNLYLVLQLQELGLPVIVALTMMDEAKSLQLDVGSLAGLLKCPVVPIMPRAGAGLELLRTAMRRSLKRIDAPVPWVWQPSARLEDLLQSMLAAFPLHWPQNRALALWALMSIDDNDELEQIPDGLRHAVLARVTAGSGIDDEAIQARYRWLDQHVASLLKGEPDRRSTDRADSVLIHPVWGFAVFLAIMFVVFQSLFAWADPAISLIEETFSALGAVFRSLLPEGIIADFMVDGLIAGVGSVIVFLPQILLLFFLLGLMEDSGYLARVAYLMDRIMKSMGLHGRAFVPMLSGFACAIPAIMATRTMERTRDRLLTMMVIPFMTCSARLPVYTLIIGALFPATYLLGVFPTQGLLMIGMYLFSVSISLFAAWGLSRTLFKAPPIPLVLELPPYRLPRLRDVINMMWRRTRAFLTEAGTVILTCTVLLWAVLYFPRATYEQGPPAGLSGDALVSYQHRQQGEALRKSYGGQLGQLIEPVIAPLGFDWKIGVGLIGAFAAREVFVATMGVVYNVGNEVDEQSTTLRQKIRNEARADGKPVYSPLVGLSLMVFFALACQCMSTLAVVKRETRGWKWPFFLFAYMTATAWGLSFLVYQGGRMLGMG